MARLEEVTVTLIDDFDGGTAVETLKFGLDGKAFEIDLSKSNASELRRTLKPYVERGRPERRRNGSNSAATRRPEGYDRTVVRAWAKANRVKVNQRGRIPNEVVQRWRESVGV